MCVVFVYITFVLCIHFSLVPPIYVVVAFPGRIHYFVIQHWLAKINVKIPAAFKVHLADVYYM